MKSHSKQKFPNSKMAAPAIEKSDIANIYLFLGEEEGEKDRFISLIGDAYFGKKTPIDQRPLSRFYMQSGDAVSAAAFALSSSMFDPKKICIVADIEKAALKQDQLMIGEMIRDLPDSTLLIMISQENTAPKFITDELMSLIQPVVFWRMFENELQNHITLAFKEKGRIIDFNAARRILSLTGRDLRKVNAAIDRILTGTDEAAVTEKSVITLIADEKEISIFELIDAVFKRRKDSLLLLCKVIDEGAAELQVIALLEREAKRIELYHELRTHGLTHDDAIGDLHISPKGMDDFTAYLKAFPASELKKFMVLLSKADYAAKSSRLSGSILSSPVAGIISETLR